ncbi:lysophospholipid acyltransferase family protein [Agilicoccus flavus]|uniref:lysophospholipid acyltransferase family protein n=1 Tax=Agilicoccus flavus TaxID=2775968 RepID=UPI001CF67000|nr:lysophospholipid acyltransferase family protein [Agilicoccus flavus]
MLYWFLKVVVLGPALKLLFRPWVEGAENVPREGGAILASNHLSFSDSIFLPLVLSRRITFPAKMEYFTAPGVKGRLKALFFRGTGQIPIDRSGGSASQAAIEAGLAVLRRGELFGIYPEGTRSPDGRLYRGKTGVARMALTAGVPIIPVAMIDTDKAQPTGQKIPNITRVGVRFGEPMDFSRYADRVDDRAVQREITDQVMAELARLSNRPYVDEYAATRKEQLAARAEELVRSARAETAAAAAKAEEFLATARLESAAKAEQIITTARSESAAAAARAEEMVRTARTRSRLRREDGDALREDEDAPPESDDVPAEDVAAPRESGDVAAAGTADRSDPSDGRLPGEHERGPQRP